MDSSNAGQVIEVNITGSVYGGDGIGKLPDGKSIFVPYTLPGEVVQARVIDSRKNFAKGQLLQVLSPSPERILPRCRHFATCGGCHYQNLEYDRQLALKQQVFTDQLKRIGKFDAPLVRPIRPSPAPWNYRNTVQFHVSENGRLGFRGARSAEIIEISECHLPEASINELWPQLEIDPQYAVQRTVVRQGSDGDLLLGFECDHDDAPDFSVDFPLSVVFLGKTGDLLLSGEPTCHMQVKGVDFLVSARSFFQVNTAQAEAMVDFVLENAKIAPGACVLDLYCGVGLFSRFLAPQAGSLIGIELSESACNDYASNLEDFDHVSLYIGAVEEILPALQEQPDLVLLDPPRSGLDQQVVDQLLRLAPQQIMYVSCDPSTLARDLRLLTAGGYALDQVQPFDLFPQTYHIESISILSR